MLVPLLLTLVVIFMVVIGCTRRYRYSGLPLPPGPRGLPVIGNLLDAPNKYQWIRYAEWAKEYNSDIIHLQVLGTSIIILNSLECVTEILNRRSALSSSRPVSIMLNKLMGWDWNFGLIPYGNPWRARRRLFWQEFNPANSFLHRPTQLKYARQFIQSLLNNPEEFAHHARYSPGSAIIEVAYGLDVQPKDDPTIARADKAIHHLDSAGITGTFMVDNLPILQYLPRWFPGAGFRRYADLAYAETMDMIELPYRQVRELIDEGKARPSVILRAYTRNETSFDNQDSEKVVKDVASVAYSAGIDTTPSPMITFFAAMTLYPEVQKKAQQELDVVIGSRLPTFDDLSSLPYTQAILWEIMRWMPVLPLGISHLLMSEDVYNGYLLPKGSTIFANVWTIFRDETIFPHPDKFIPDRFIKDGKLDMPLIDIVEIGFGFGRRICPGRFFARETLWILMVSTLTVFDITKAKDELGCDIVPELDSEPLLVTMLKPFKCTIQPRSKEAEKLIWDADLL